MVSSRGLRLEHYARLDDLFDEFDVTWYAVQRRVPESSAYMALTESMVVGYGLGPT